MDFDRNFAEEAIGIIKKEYPELLDNADVESFKIRMPASRIDGGIRRSYDSQVEVDLKDVFIELIRYLRYSLLTEEQRSDLSEFGGYADDNYYKDKVIESEKILVYCKKKEVILWLYRKKDSSVNYFCWLCGKREPGGDHKEMNPERVFNEKNK